MSNLRVTPGKGNPFICPPRNSCPIHKLTVEILSYLFEWVAHLKNPSGESDTDEIAGKVYAERKPRRCRCPWYKYYNDSDCVCGSEEPPPWFPVYLVCRYWYDIATSTPSLWTNIVVTPRSRPPFYRITKQLEQSKDLPIDIRIDLENFEDPPRSVVDSFCSLLVTKADHWRSLELRVYSCEKMLQIHDAIFKTGTQINATLLRSMVLSGCGDERSTHELSKLFVLFGRSAPHLNTISLDGVGVDWNQDWICSASHLTTLEITTSTFPSWGEFVAILRGAPRLQVLALRNYRTDHVRPAWVDPRLTGANPVELLELKELDITLPHTIVLQFLRRCYVPCLKKLMLHFSLEDNSDRRAQELEAIVAQLVAPLPHASTPSSPGPFRAPRSLLAGLEHLRLGCYEDFSAEHVNAMYRHMDRLTSLSVKGLPAFVDPLFTPTGRMNDVKLPRLKALAISSYLNSLETRQLVALAWHRKDVGVPLRALSLTRCGVVSRECLTWCEENLEAFRFD